MALEKKKLAAISAAVFTYIKTEEEAAFLASSAGQNQEITAGQTGPALNLNIWGTAGREHQMQLRSMIQMRVFK